MAITSKEINLAQLTQELGGRGLIADFNNKAKKLILPADGYEISNDELEMAIASHIAEPEKDYAAIKESARAKLAALGLTSEEISAIS